MKEKSSTLVRSWSECGQTLMALAWMARRIRRSRSYKLLSSTVCRNADFAKEIPFRIRPMSANALPSSLKASDYDICTQPGAFLTPLSLGMDFNPFCAITNGVE